MTLSAHRQDDGLLRTSTADRMFDVASPRTPSAKQSARSPRTIRGLDAEQRRAQRREQLLAAALDLIARHGYANTSIEQICQTAYVGNKAFYELFDSKEDCYLALLREINDQVHRKVAKVLEQSPDDPHETERRALSVFAHALVDDPRIAMVTFGQAAGVSPNVERQRRANRRQAATLIESFWRQHEFIDAASDDGDGDGIDLRALSIATVGGLFDTVADWLQDNDPPQPPTIAALITDLTAFVAVVRAGMAAHHAQASTPT
jgi:AcrR family transcriptional regulator